jgi:DNA-binding NarL/FixJ family response regulator
MKKIRLLIYEDNDVLRQSVLLMMQGTPDIQVVGAFGNCSGVREQVKEWQPDVVLMDIDMPGHNGIYGTAVIKQQSPHINVLMYTVFDDDEKLFAALEAGADGYLLKNTSPLKVYEAVKDVILGSAPLSPGVAQKVLNVFHQRPLKKEPEQVLTEREKEILNYLVKGYTYKSISAQCGITLDTVKTHIKNIYAKLQVSSGKEAVAKVMKYNF